MFTAIYNENRTGTSLKYTNLTGSFNSMIMSPASTIEIGKLTQVTSPGYDLRNWVIDVMVAPPLTRGGSQAIYISSQGSLYTSEYQLKLPNILQMGYARWEALFTESPRGAQGFHTRGYDISPVTFVIHAADDPLRMFMGSNTEFGYVSRNGGGTWMPQYSKLQPAIASFASLFPMIPFYQSAWSHSTTGTSLWTEPSVFLINSINITGEFIVEVQYRVNVWR